MADLGLAVLDPDGPPDPLSGTSGPPDPDSPRALTPGLTVGDRIFRNGATAAGTATLVLLVLIGSFLLLRALPTFRDQGFGFFTKSVYQPTGAHPSFGIAGVLYFTVIIAIVALVVALPVSLLASLFLTEYAPRRLRRLLTGLVDLLAAVPSIVYGLWGLFFLVPRSVGTIGWLDRHLHFIPFFAASRPIYTGSALLAGVVVSLMVVPICTSVMREVFSQAPLGEKEAALALGSTRWGMIRTVVLPFGRGGIVGGAMLGLGRALGETIAVAVVIAVVFKPTINLISPGANGVAPLIALKFGEANPASLSALMAAGLTLFVLTLGVNFLASVVVGRSRSGAGVDL